MTNRSESTKRDPLRGLVWAAYALIVFTVGRGVEIVPGLSSLPSVKLVLVYIAFALIAHRKVLPPLIAAGNPAVKWALAFAVWIVISFAFSIWLGPSRDFVLVQLPILVMVVIVIGKLSGEWRLLKSLFFILVVAAMILAVPGLLGYAGGRLSVQSAYDTNELAYVLDGVIPTALAFGMTESSRPRRLIFYGAAAIMALAVVLTGSRGGMFGLLVVIAVIVLEPGTLQPKQPVTKPVVTRNPKMGGKPKMGAKTRILLSLLACVIVGVSVWPHLPPETTERLSSMLSLSSDYNVSEDVGRVQIWKRGMQALADRPIGYGINTFPKVDWLYGGKFYTAHNSLVLIAVELGPVGIVMYLTMFTLLWRGLSKSRTTLTKVVEPTEQQRQQAVFCRMSQASLAGNFVAGLFLSASYFYAHWVNIALAMAFIAFINRENPGPALEPRRMLRR
jgi:O-antigen ligase